MSRDDLISNEQSITGGISNVHFIDEETSSNASTLTVRRIGIPRNNTVSGTLTEHEATTEGNLPPTSPVSRSSAGARNAALRRAALLIRASRSAASLQGTGSLPRPGSLRAWPPPPPSRSQSLNFAAPPVQPCCCCGTPGDTQQTLNGGQTFVRSPSRTSEDPEAQSNPDGSLTPNGLSWRRLHVSRAKLKATATTSELLSGFAMVAMVELQINDNTKVPEWLFVLFSICTTVLVSVHIFALMISTYILPNIDAISRLQTSELVVESPHERMRWFIELAWGFSTVLGLFLFLVEVAILCWVKFWDYSFTAAVASTIIVVPSLAIFVGFAVHFYHTLVVHKCEASDLDLKQLEIMKQQLDIVTEKEAMGKSSGYGHI